MEAVIQKLTYQAFREMDLPDDENTLYELLNGEIVAKNSPSFFHQRISANLFRAMDAQIQTKQLGELFTAPLNVLLDEYNAPQPDLLFIRKERDFILNHSEGTVEGAPDLVVEILSSTSIRRDRYDKMAIYEQSAIREYWIVDPNNKAVEIFTMRENRYQLASFAAVSGLVQSTVLENFELEVATLF